MTSAADIPVTRLAAADLMSTELVCVGEHESVAAAWELLARGRFHHLPVMRGELCVGLLDDRTLVQVWTPGALSRTRRTVGELLPRRVPSVAPSTPLLEVARRMQEYGTDALVVVDVHGRLLGVVTVTDLVKALAGGLT